MDNNTDVRENFQTYMIVWDVHLQTTPYEQICIYSPDIRLSKVESLPDKITILLQKTLPWTMESQSYYHRGIQPILHGTTASIEFRSERNRSSKEFKCTIYMLDRSRKTINRTFIGLGTHKLDYNGEWAKKCCYVFQFKFKCSPSNVKPAIWIRGSTETIPLIDIKERLNTELSVITVKSAKSPSLLKFINLKNNPCKILLQGSDLNIHFLEQKYEKHFYQNHFYQNHVNFSILRDKNDISNIEYLLAVKPFEEMNENDITELANIMKVPQITAENQKNLKDLRNTQTIPAVDLKPSSYLHAYFIEKKLCDVTVHVQDHLIRAHRVALANGSQVWRDMFFANDTLTSVQVVDFDYGTIQNLIEYIYIGKANKETATDQLLIAAEKYGVYGLKKQCETFLCDTIEMKTCAYLLVLAHKCNATALFSKVVVYIGENRSEFRKLNEARSIFMTYPELAFELFASI